MGRREWWRPIPEALPRARCAQCNRDGRVIVNRNGNAICDDCRQVNDRHAEKMRAKAERRARRMVA